MRATLHSALILLLLTASCKIWDPSHIGVRNDPMDPKLLWLAAESIRDKDYIEFPEACSDQMINQEVHENLCAYSEESYGKIRITSKRTKYKIGIYYSVLSGLTLTVANLFGMPFGIAKMEVQVDLEILNNHGEVIARYTEKGEAKNTCAYYYGYGINAIHYKTQPEAVSNALDKIRPQIQKDVEKLNESLRSFGTL